MTTPTKTLYDSKSTAKPSKVSQDLLAGSVKAEDCPWVKVGQLHLSVTITGDESWLPLLALLHKNGHKKFSVFSGRHGDIPNIVDKTGTTHGVFDKNHIAEDEAVKKKALGQFKDITIEIVDTHAGKTGQAKWLEGEANKRLNANTPVIFAWCYSLFTMSEFHHPGVGSKLTESQSVKYVAAQSTEINKPISEIVQTNFAWAL